MEGPIISVDVSNGNSHYMLFEKNNKRIGNVKFICHDVEGFDQLKKDFEKLRDCTQSAVCVVFEATGVYTKPLERFLMKNDIRHYIVSPLESARQRKKEIHSKKTDKLDPIAISKVYYDKADMIEHKVEKDIYHELRQWNRLYEDRLNHLRKAKVTLQNDLSVCFPGFLKLFKDACGDAQIAILKKYPHPDLIKNKSVHTVARYIEKHTCHKTYYAIRMAEKIIEFANKTYPGCDKDDIEVTILLRQLKTVEELRKECDDILETITSLASTLDEYEWILSIDGVGPNLAGRIIAEIGDIRRFKSREALIAYVGLDPNINQSGTIDGKHLSISKKGNKRLRCLLYLAVTCSIRTKKDNPINRFYNKKRQQSTPLQSKAAKIACTAKTIKIIYGMCKNGTTYQK